jgi:hypothetical protein
MYISDHREVSFCKADNNSGLDLCKINARVRRSLEAGNDHLDKFFGIMGIFYRYHMDLSDNLFSIDGSHSLAFWSIFFSRQMIFRYNQLYLKFCHSNRWLDVFFYRGSISHNDNFFNNDVCHTLGVFNIFYHIGKRYVINYIWRDVRFFSSYILQECLRINRVCISHYDIFPSRDVDKMVLFSSDMVFHMSVVPDLYQVLDF